MNQPTVFERAWADPEAFGALYADTQHGFLVLPDTKPVTSNHLMVIPKEPVALVDDLADNRYRQLWELVRVTRQHMLRVLQPARGVATCVFGNQVPHVHIHVFARDEPGDGALFFSDDRPQITPEALAALRTRLAFPLELQHEAILRVAAADRE